MQIEELFEKRERTIYQLLLYLEDCVETPTIKEVCQVVHLSKATFLRYLHSFNEQAQKDGLGLTFSMEQEKIAFIKSNQLSKEALIAYLIQESIAYQILFYLADKNEFSIPYLAQKLSVSEATLNRQLASLNKLLSDFNLSIRGGKLKGSELQIRYFYHQLFRVSLSPSSLQEQERLTSFEHQIEKIETFYNTKFNAYQTHQLWIWLLISHKRSRLTGSDFKSMKQLMQPYQEHKFYQQLKTLYEELSTEEEVMCFFAFLFSHFLLAPHQLEQVLGFGGPIMEATFLAFQHYRSYLDEHLPVSEQALHHLNQVMSQFYFFTSSIQLESPENHPMEKEVEKVLRKIATLIFQRKGAFKSVFTPYIPKMVALYTYFNQVKPIQVRVAFLSLRHEVLSYPTLVKLREKLELNRRVFIEPYEEGECYDFLITDYQEISRLPVYCISSRLKEHDFVQLKQMILEVYTAKSKQSEKLLQTPSFPMEHR